ncbi:cation transporter [Pontibacter sp. E15-1]|uniref:heavy-metal-associated domain-containing protein n=1 Tax=Pontibacter sp. E15-1 TaxID=2919918 RepID=UPI001F4FADDB|nr:heavy-metal-associated domain-containing protein [Pontibacter sp. E15-1]MCJ8167123.1 cation transporter [Pontibacter sp. E15-1]
MRKNILITALMFGSFASVSAQAQDTQNTKQNATAQAAESATFNVNGKCGMCKKRIEKAALGLEGVQSAVWDVESTALSVKYDPAKVSEADIQKQVASVGHDTAQVKATDEAYDSLPGCCQYERK